MIKAIAIIGIILALVLAGTLIYAATKPDTFRIQRSTSIKAPPEKIFPLINEFDRWGAWSPYENRDPAMKRTRSGPSSGKGAVYGWEGNRQIGTGRMEILEASPPSKIVIKLDFFKPFEAHNTAEFTLDGNADTTGVTWASPGRCMARRTTSRC